MSNLGWEALDLELNVRERTLELIRETRLDNVLFLLLVLVVFALLLFPNPMLISMLPIPI